MVRNEKLEEKIRNNIHHVTFDELKKLLEFYGFVLTNKTGGSHYMVYHPSIKSPIKPLPKKTGHLKSYLVKEFLSWIDELKKQEDLL